MSELKATPGPWQHKATKHPHRQDGAHWREIIDVDNGCVLGEVFHDQDEDEPFVTDDIAEANAHLIAAAPALYEALEQAVDALASLRGELEPPLSQVVHGLAALALARGDGK